MNMINEKLKIIYMNVKYPDEFDEFEGFVPITAKEIVELPNFPEIKVYWL